MHTTTQIKVGSWPTMALNKGYEVRRQSWPEGKAMKVIQPHEWEGLFEIGKPQLMVRENGSWGTWCNCQEDVLAEDWVVDFSSKSFGKSSVDNIPKMNEANSLLDEFREGIMFLRKHAGIVNPDIPIHSIAPDLLDLDLFEGEPQHKFTSVVEVSSPIDSLRLQTTEEPADERSVATDPE